jgi:hypothetical protein
MQFKSLSFKVFLYANVLMFGLFAFFLVPAILLKQLEFNGVEIVELLSIYMGMTAVISTVCFLTQKSGIAKYFLVEFILLAIIFAYLGYKFNVLNF